MAEHSVTDEDTRAGLLTRWRQTEPVRLWLYGIAVPLLALLVGYGFLTEHALALWLAVFQAALLGAGTELARGFAVSPATARAAVQEAAEHYEGGRDVGRTVLVRYSIPAP